MSRNRATPFRDGFAALWHEPLLLVAELAWRWCFGLCAIVLGIFSFALFLNSLQVSKTDQFLLSTLQPRLLAAAITHILHGSLARFVLQQSLLLLGLTLLWSLASAAGRAAVLRRLVSMFSIDEDPDFEHTEWHFGSIFLLHLLRAMWVQVAVAAAIALFAYGSVMSDEKPLTAALALSFGVGFSCMAGFWLNWYFAIAPLFCVRNGVSAQEAMEQSVTFSARSGGRLFAMGLGYSFLRLMWLGIMASAILWPLKPSGTIGNRWVVLLMGVAALVYFVGADLVGLARWGSYVSLAEEDARPAPEPEPAVPTAPLLQTSYLEGLA
jgi:hypothetical protein